MPALPPPTNRAARLDRMRRICRAHGLPLTAPRDAILEALVDLDTHPTADEVHGEAARRMPGIGRATVYRALESFVRIGVLTKATHHGAAVRYDTNLGRHHHLVCLECDRILDLEDPALDAVPIPDTSGLGFEVEDVQVQLRGICAQCRKRQRPESLEEEDS